jgi:hypothetical protein
MPKPTPPTVIPRIYGAARTCNRPSNHTHKIIKVATARPVRTTINAVTPQLSSRTSLAGKAKDHRDMAVKHAEFARTVPGCLSSSNVAHPKIIVIITSQ